MATYTFTATVEVHMAEALHAVAAAHPDGEGLELRDPDGNVDVAACLIVLLDPGYLAGCKIVFSDATEAEHE